MSEVQAAKLEILSEASALLRRVTPPQQNVKATIAHAARKLGWGYRRTRAIYYGEQRRIDAHEVDALRREAAAVAHRLERMADALEQIDAAFHREEISRLRSQVHALCDQIYA